MVLGDLGAEYRLSPQLMGEHTEDVLWELGFWVSKGDYN